MPGSLGPTINALKFLNDKGEFISAEDGNTILEYIEQKNINYVPIDNFGRYYRAYDGGAYHIDRILELSYVEAATIRKRKPRVVVDCINSTGAIFIPMLLEKLGCEFDLINEQVNGEFAHNPEPLPAHLEGLSIAVIEGGYDMGIAVDPDVDRLAFVCEDGTMFGEEYTLVAVADYILRSQPSGNTVSNLSSTRALAEVTAKYGGTYAAAAVGEVNVVNMMKDTNAVIGGEGNGGVILSELHYGRDALAGIAIFLTSFCKEALTLSQIRDSFPKYSIIKDKISVEGIDLDQYFHKLRKAFSAEKINEIDGMKIDFTEGWVHMRKSNTEPIVRIYAEAENEEAASSLVMRVKTALGI